MIGGVAQGDRIDLKYEIDNLFGTPLCDVTRKKLIGHPTEPEFLSLSNLTNLAKLDLVKCLCISLRSVK